MPAEVVGNSARKGHHVEDRLRPHVALRPGLPHSSSRGELDEQQPFCDNGLQIVSDSVLTRDRARGERTTTLGGWF